MPIFTCPVCGESFANFGQLGAHKRWGHRAQGPTVGKTPRARRVKIEDASGAAVDPPSPATPPASAGEEAEGAVDGGTLRIPRVASPSIRITPEHRAASTRDAIRDALSEQVLASIIKSFSVSLSEADGAGQAGYLSDIQAAQVDNLLYDATIDLVADRFAGNVTRFKAALAVLVIVLSKGTVHARAIAARVRERRELRQSSEAASEAVDTADPANDDPVGAFQRTQRLAKMSLEEQVRFNAG